MSIGIGSSWNDDYDKGTSKFEHSIDVARLENRIRLLKLEIDNLRSEIAMLKNTNRNL